MTDEAGGGLPQELRERIAYQAFKAVGNYPAVADWQALADAILAEIAAAGYELVPVARMGECEDAFGECYHDLNECRGLDS